MFLRWTPLLIALLAEPTVAQAPPTERNLLPNPSFEAVEAGQPAGWRWLPGAAKAEFALDTVVARSGRQSVKIVNPTPRAPNVYGRLVAGVRLTEGRTYTLSCYVKSDDPGVAWIGTGKKWEFRFAFPAAPDWTRVVGTFEANDSSLEVMILSESVTKGLWVDDVQLEPGATATPFVYREPLQPGQTELTVLQGDWVSLGPNLVENSSFERLDGGLPKGWSFDRRNTDATMAVDETVAHSGSRSLRFTNGTPFGAHVYGMLSYIGGLELEPDQDYTLSCYVRSKDPGIAWIGGGPGWRIRLRFPQTDGAWERVVTSFHTEAERSGFPLLVISESPTEGFWIDDVKLERGAEATPYVSEEAGAVTQILLQLPAEMTADKTLDLAGWLYAPADLPDARVSVELRSAEGKLLAEGSWQGAVGQGIAYAAFRSGLGGDEPQECVLTMTVSQGGQAPASGKAEFRLYTVGRERQRLALTRERAAQVRGLFDRVRAKGLDGAYPLVSLTVADNFCDFVEDDLNHLQVLRAGQQLDEIGLVLDRAQAELQALLDGKAKQLVVPRYVTSPIEVQGTSFIATVRWPDGRQERRPVFFSGYGHFSSVKRDVEKLPAYGLNIIQVEFGPNSTVISETENSMVPVEDFERLLQRAAASNVAVNLLLSPHYFPQWAYEKWPEVGGVNGGFIHFSVDAPQTRAVIERHLRLVASSLKGKPGLHSYCLSNEPIYVDPSKDPYNEQKWVGWLKGRYSTLEALNAAHRATYGSFESVPVPVQAEPKTTPLFYDWCRFNDERFAGWHRWMADVIHEEDPAALVHAKTMNTLFQHSLQGWGIDQELFCDLSQIAGNDSWKWFAHQSGDWASSWQPENMHFDLQRSCCGKPIFNSENHVIIDRDLQPVPGVHVRNVLWQAAVHGEGASTMWVWERTFDDRSDFAGSIMHRPDCADAHGRVALDLMRLAPEVTALQQAPARIAVIYSIASLVYGGTDSEAQLSRVYRALNFLGEKLDFITERQLAAGKAGRYKVIVAPGITHLPEEALRGLAAFDGLVLTAGDGCFAKDDRDQPWQGGLPKHIAPLSKANDRELRDEIARLTQEALPRKVRVQDADGQTEAWGVEWQSAPYGDGLLVNLVNYTQKPLRVTVEGPQGPATDLIAGKPADEPLALQPLEPVLLRFGNRP
jgi:hypothetical protein